MKYLIAVTIALTSTLAHAFPTRNVQYGGEAELDACGASGYTLTQTVVIRQSPEGYTSFDTVVPAGTLVSYCDADGEYTGVVIQDESKDCEVGGPVPQRKDYDGPCTSGWIKTAFLVLVAG